MYTSTAYFVRPQNKSYVSVSSTGKYKADNSAKNLIVASIHGKTLNETHRAHVLPGIFRF